MEYSAEIKKSLDSLYGEINQKSRNVAVHLKYIKKVLNDVRSKEDKGERVESIDIIKEQINT